VVERGGIWSRLHLPHTRQRRQLFAGDEKDLKWWAVDAVAALFLARFLFLSFSSHLPDFHTQATRLYSFFLSFAVLDAATLLFVGHITLIVAIFTHPAAILGLLCFCYRFCLS
jgi:hypothetical protein